MEGARALYDFHGRTGIVTGAGSGIGRATAELLAAEGASVALALFLWANRGERRAQRPVGVPPAGGGDRLTRGPGPCEGGATDRRARGAT